MHGKIRVFLYVERTRILTIETQGDMMAQTVKSDQERADELANNIKITKDVVTVSGAMMYTDVRSARMLHEIGGELIDASDEMRDATNKIA
jgi:hypothetical protein